MTTAIDLFAGGGGSSEGARQAGVAVRWAANHSRRAVEMHKRNHPETEHECQDLHQCDWLRAREIRPDIVLASPACQGHSKAATSGGVRGSLPKHDADRSTAWAVVSCLEATSAEVAIVENVVEFRSWRLYPSWLDALRRLGYSAAEHVVDAAHLSTPQRRVRLFVVLSRSRAPLFLDLPRELDIGPMPLVPNVRDVTADKDESRWRLVADLPPKARERIYRAIDRCGPDCSVNYVTDDVGTPLHAPSTTITTRHQRAWIRRGRRGFQRRMWTSREYARAMGFPDSYLLTGRVSIDCRLLGNAVCPPVMRRIIEALP